MKNIAIITARGGSKRIPQKNIKNFMGKPMIAYAIDACLESGVYNEVMVSTDCAEISKISKKYGANVPFLRSAKTSDDFATTFDVLEEVINEYKKRNQEFDNVCCVYPCVPFLKSKTLKDAYEKFITSIHDGLMPVCKYPVPIEWAMKIENDLLIPNDRKAQNIRSQDLEPKYFDVGMFYFLKTEIMMMEKTIVLQKTSPYLMNEMEIQDIDTEEDWAMAELKYKLTLEL